MYTKSIKLVLSLLLFVTCFGVVSQEITAPQFTWEVFCAKGAINNSDISFEKTSDFNSDNQFIVEISDANGNFANLKEVLRITSQNNKGIINTSFQIPPGTFGTGFKLRVRSTSPEKISPESKAFPAYDVFDGVVIPLNGGKRAVLCGTTNQEFFLSITTEGAYDWYKDEVFFKTTVDPKLLVSEPGKYQARIVYGTSCGSALSTNLFVTRIDNSNAQIEGDSTVSICSNNTHEFKSVEPFNDKYTYNWYKDNVLVSTSNSSTYITPNVNQFGTYRLEVLIPDPNDSSKTACTSNSQEVVLEQKSTANFTITNLGAIKTVWIPGEGRELEISVSSTTATIEWYKDGDLLPGKNGPKIVINAPAIGEYHAVVTDDDGTCSFSVNSEVFTLLKTDELKTTIVAAGYKECDTDKTKLTISKIVGVGSDGVNYDLTDKQLSVLTYQWYKDGALIAGKTEKELDIASYEENGSYELEVSAGLGLKTKSAPLEIKLSFKIPEITTTATSNSLCAGGEIEYEVSEIIVGLTYTWFKDGVALTVVDPKTLKVTEVGVYVLKIDGIGCSKELTPIEVIPFDDSAIKVSPSEKVVLVLGEFTMITASGANSYEWYEGEDSTGILLSSNAVLEVSKLGFYTVVAKVDDCAIEKTIEVVEQDDQIVVPNIVSPYKEDGINDTWEISNRYAFQPEVEIKIYNTNGKQVLATTDYKNDWPLDDLGNQKIFYYQIIRNDAVVKAGTISILD